MSTNVPGFDDEDNEMINEIEMDEVPENTQEDSQPVSGDELESEAELDASDEEEELGDEEASESGVFFRPSMSKHEEKARKAKLLWAINKYNSEGQYSSKHVDMSCSIDELENEKAQIENKMNLDKGGSFVKYMYLGVANGFQTILNRQTIAKVNMVGWSDKVKVDINTAQYEKVFMEIYDKYFSTVTEVDPLLTLAGMTFMSLASYYMDTREDPMLKEAEMEEEERELEEMMEKMEKTKKKKRRSKKKKSADN